MAKTYKQILKQLLDGASLTPEALAILWNHAPTEVLRASAGVLRHRYWGRLHGIFRWYQDGQEAQDYLEQDKSYGYRTFWFWQDDLIKSVADNSYVHKAVVVDGKVDFWSQLFLIAGRDDLDVIVLATNQAQLDDEILRQIICLRLVCPTASLGMLGSTLQCQDIVNLTLMVNEVAKKEQVSLFEDEVYRNIRSRHIPYHRYLAPIKNLNDIGILEAEAALCLRELGIIMPDEDTRIDAIRFSNHNLFTNAPRFPDNFAKALQNVDDGVAPKSLRLCK